MAISRRRLEPWEHFLRAHASITRRLDADLVAEHGLTLSEYDVLVQLARAPDGQLRPTQLADKVLLTRSGITRLLGRLEGKKLVERHPCAEDGRVTYAAITAAGRAKRDKARETHLRGVAALFVDRIDADEARSLAGVFRRLASPK